jgi:hypothetical protein
LASGNVCSGCLRCWTGGRSLLRKFRIDWWARHGAPQGSVLLPKGTEIANQIRPQASSMHPILKLTYPCKIAFTLAPRTHQNGNKNENEEHTLTVSTKLETFLFVLFQYYWVSHLHKINRMLITRLVCELAD